MISHVPISTTLMVGSAFTLPSFCFHMSPASPLSPCQLFCTFFAHITSSISWHAHDCKVLRSYDLSERGFSCFSTWLNSWTRMFSLWRVCGRLMESLCGLERRQLAQNLILFYPLLLMKEPFTACPILSALETTEIVPSAPYDKAKNTPMSTQ